MHYPSLARRLPFYLALALLTQCSKCKQDPTPAKAEDQLPPATQTGAGTFGCLLNGQPWTPSGNNGYPNLLVTYDPTYHGGNLDLRTYRYLGNTGKSQYISFGGDQIDKPGTYNLMTPSNSTNPGPYTVFYSDDSKTSPCNFYNYLPGTTTTTGQLVITRLDKTQGIVSGTFTFTLAQPGCDTVKITQGRFDSKL